VIPNIGLILKKKKRLRWFVLFDVYANKVVVMFVVFAALEHLEERES
jgi:hypothetical protein